MPEILDYSPPAPKEGSLPLWALIVGLLSGPATLGANFLIAGILDRFDPFIQIPSIVVIQFGAFLFAAIVRSRSPHFTRGRLLATTGVLLSVMWFLGMCGFSCWFMYALAHM